MDVQNSRLFGSVLDGTSSLHKRLDLYNGELSTSLCHFDRKLLTGLRELFCDSDTLNLETLGFVPDSTMMGGEDDESSDLGWEHFVKVFCARIQSAESSK